MLEKIFTWWSGATLGVLFTIGRSASLVGEDDYGNRYYQSRTARGSYDGRLRRWVIYKGYADASKVPADWHGWLHYTFDAPPTEAPLTVRAWEKPHLPNLTGTPYAYRPKGSIVGAGERARAAADYQPWTPD